MLPRLLRSRQLRAEDVLDERIRLESISTAIGASGVMVIACVMYFIFPMDLSRADYLIYWVIAQLLVGISWLLFIYLHRRYPTPVTRSLWPYLSTLVCSFYGLIWGLGWVFFVSDTSTDHIKVAVIFTIILGGVFTGGVLATLFHLPSLISFTLCALIPPLFSSFLHEGVFHMWFGLSLSVYMLACAAFALNLNNFLLETLEQREQKNFLAQQLAEEKQRFEKISLDKTRFLAAASHDLRQPLQALHFFHHALKDLPEQTIEAQYILERMGGLLAALNDLLNAMLDIAHLDEGQQPVRKQPFPLDLLLRRIYEQYRPLAIEAGLDLHYASTSYYANSDPILVERIVQNLVHNAIKHMGTKGRILLGVRQQGQQLRIEVRDNGIGIPQQEQEAIFREFYQLYNPERNRNQGIGLGLSIVKRLANLLDQELSLWSQPGKGCIFSITIPQALPQAVPAQVLTQSEIQTNSVGKVLVIEDDEQVLESLELLLKFWGHQVIAINNPDPPTLMAEHPDLSFIISDYQLSAGQNGIELIQELRSLGQREIPALLITGNTAVDLKPQLSELNIAISYKPISPSQIKNTLKIITKVSY